MTRPTPAPTPIRIDFVSDIACPWCAVGLLALEEAIASLGDAIAVELCFQPFELNPHMPAEGEDAIAHLTAKYGISAEQARRNGEVIAQRGAELGFAFDMDRRTRVYNTFDAHRLLHWAGEQGPAAQRALKLALLRAYFSDGRDVSDHDVLRDVAGLAGLDAAAASAVLESDAHAAQVRARQAVFAGNGIAAVPSVIIDGRHLVQGAQPVAVFERALRQAARSAAAPA